MTQEQREEAADTIMRLWNRSFRTAKDDAALSKALDTAITALRSGWVRTAERLPTEADVIKEISINEYRIPYLLAIDTLDDGQMIIVGTPVKLVIENPTKYPWWYEGFALPAMPEVEHEAR